MDLDIFKNNQNSRSTQGSDKAAGPTPRLTLIKTESFKSDASIFDFFKLGNMGGTLLSMLVMMMTYAHSDGWSFAVGYVVLILVHELGHGYAAMKLGIKVSAPIFIPYMGAFVKLAEEPKTNYENFLISAGGPYAGTMAALVCMFLARFFNWEMSRLLLLLSYSALTMNLFNLIPFGGLDGGRMTKTISSTAWFFGLLLLGFCVYVSPHPLSSIGKLVLFLSIVKLFEIIHREQNDDDHFDEDLRVSIGYFALTGFLIYFTSVIKFSMATY